MLSLATLTTLGMAAVEDAVERAEPLQELEAAVEMASWKDSLELAEMVDKATTADAPNCSVAAGVAGAVEMGLCLGILDWAQMAVKEARVDAAAWREAQAVLEGEVVMGCLWEMTDKEGTVEGVETVVKQRCLVVVDVPAVLVMGLYSVTMSLVETPARAAGAVRW